MTEQTEPSYIPRFSWLKDSNAEAQTRGFEFPTVNLDLLRQVVEWVEEEAAKPIPERKWYQASWRVQNLAAMLGIHIDESATATVNCGTACCVAGHAVTLAGAVWLDDETLLAVEDEDEPWTIQREYEWNYDEESYVSGVDVSTRAQRILGLTGEEARSMFEGSNDVRNIREVAEIVAERAGATL